MTEQSHISEFSHPTASLLPFYLNGTLTEAERQEVDRHLVECESCRRELEEMRSLQVNVKSYFSTLPQPPADVFGKVKAQILDESPLERKESPPVSARETRSLGTRFQDYLHSLFATHWAPALAVSLILGQAVVLFWTLTFPSTAPRGAEDQEFGPVIERSVPQAPVPIARQRLRIAFQDHTPEHIIRRTIRHLDGRIVDGPTAEGVYIIEVPESDAERLETIIQELDENKDVIRMAVPLTSSPP